MDKQKNCQNQRKTKVFVFLNHAVFSEMVLNSIEWTMQKTGCCMISSDTEPEYNGLHNQIYNHENFLKLCLL